MSINTIAGLLTAQINQCVDHRFNYAFYEDTNCQTQCRYVDHTKSIKVIARLSLQRFLHAVFKSLQAQSKRRPVDCVARALGLRVLRFMIENERFHGGANAELSAL